MEAHIYVSPKDGAPYATDSEETAHILHFPLIHISFATGFSLEKAIETAKASIQTDKIASEKRYVDTIMNSSYHKGIRPIKHQLIGTIRLADTQLQTETDPEKIKGYEESRQKALAQIVTEFHDYFNTQGQ